MHKIELIPTGIAHPKVRHEMEQRKPVLLSGLFERKLHLSSD